MVAINLDDTTRVFYLAQSAHQHVEQAQRSIKTYMKHTKAELTGGTFNDVLRAIVAAKEDTDQACRNWQAIADIIQGNPDMQVDRS